MQSRRWRVCSIGASVSRVVERGAMLCIILNDNATDLETRYRSKKREKPRQY